MGCWATNYLILGCPFATSATREAPIALGGICSLLLHSFMILSTLVFHGIELRYRCFYLSLLQLCTSVRYRPGFLTELITHMQ